MNKHPQTSNAYLTQQLWSRKKTATFLKRSPGTLSVWDSTKRYDLRPIRIGQDVRYCPVYIKEIVGRTFFKSEFEMQSNTRYLTEPLWDRFQTAHFFNRAPGTLSKWDITGKYDLRPIKMCREVRYCPVFIRQIAADIFFSPE